MFTNCLNNVKAPLRIVIFNTTIFNGIKNLNKIVAYLLRTVYPSKQGLPIPSD